MEEATLPLPKQLLKKKQGSKQQWVWSQWIITIIWLLYTCVPFIATFLFSISGKWNTTILPESWTLKAYREVFLNPEFYSALFRSLILAFTAVMIQLIVVLMALFAISLYSNRKLAEWIEFFAIIPVALPGVVLALGVVTFYGEVFPLLTSHPVLLIGAQAAFGLPFVYWTMQNAFRTMDVRTLYAASCTLQVPTWRFVFRVLIPSLKKGIAIAAAIGFAGSFDNFALSQLIVGSSWETFPILHYKVFNLDGHQTSAMSMIAIVLTMVLTGIAGYYSHADVKLKKRGISK